MKRYSVCITFTPKAYATIDKIHRVYKLDFAVCVPFCPARKLGPVCHQIGCHVRSSFLSGQWMLLLTILKFIVLTSIKAKDFQNKARNVF